MYIYTHLQNSIYIKKKGGKIIIIIIKKKKNTREPAHITIGQQAIWGMEEMSYT